MAVKMCSGIQRGVQWRISISDAQSDGWSPKNLSRWATNSPAWCSRSDSFSRKTQREISCFAVLDEASVRGRRAGKWSGERREAHSASQPERNGRRRGRRKPAALAAQASLPLVTSARFAKRNGRGREGEGGDRQPVERRKAARWSRRPPIAALLRPTGHDSMYACRQPRLSVTYGRMNAVWRGSSIRASR